MVRGAPRILQSDVVLSDQFLQSQDTGVSRYQVAHVCPLITDSILCWMQRLARIVPVSGEFALIESLSLLSSRGLVAFKATEPSQLTRWGA
jgi:hypothetical protein